MAEPPQREEGASPLSRIAAHDEGCGIGVDDAHLDDRVVEVLGSPCMSRLEQQPIQRCVVVLLEVLLHVPHAEAVGGLRENFPQRGFNAFLAVTQKDNPLAVAFDVERHLRSPQKPGPRFGLLDLRNPNGNWEDAAVSVERRHHKQNAAVRRLDMTGIETDNLGGVFKRSGTDPWTEECPFKNAFLSQEARRRPLVAFRHGIEKGSDQTKRLINEEGGLPDIKKSVLDRGLLDVDVEVCLQLLLHGRRLYRFLRLLHLLDLFPHPDSFDCRDKRLADVRAFLDKLVRPVFKTTKDQFE